MSSTFLEVVDPRGVATVTFNRPHHHNAFDDALIAKLTASRRSLGEETGRRIALRRASSEGHKGIAALVDKRSSLGGTTA
jgi:methylglutaconyl-CoA hydratase